jgi:hypothetical protein
LYQHRIQKSTFLEISAKNKLDFEKFLYMIFSARRNEVERPDDIAWLHGI